VPRFAVLFASNDQLAERRNRPPAPSGRSHLLQVEKWTKDGTKVDPDVGCQTILIRRGSRGQAKDNGL
jgi:hypothetical protein